MVRWCTTPTLHHRGHTLIPLELGRIARGTPDSGKLFQAAADFPAEWVKSHINVKETFALYKVLRLLVEARQVFLLNSTITVGVDNKVMFYAVKKGPAPNEQMHKLVREFF